jgi:hypothetical protein
MNTKRGLVDYALVANPSVGWILPVRRTKSSIEQLVVGLVDPLLNDGALARLLKETGQVVWEPLRVLFA